MSLSKQLYTITAFLFFIIFTGNFIISIKNTKEYLEVQSITKAQDTATSLGVGLKPLLEDKNDSEIKSLIYAIADSGFYKEIRLENAYFKITQEQLIKASLDLDNSSWNISDLEVDPLFGKVEEVTSDDELEKELALLEDEEISTSQRIKHSYIYLPSEEYKRGEKVSFNFIAKNENGKEVKTSSEILMDKVIVQVFRPIKFETVPAWFINMIPINIKEQSSEIIQDWKISAIIYVSANSGEAYAKLYNQAKNAFIYSLISFIISIFILFIFIKHILKPLNKIEKLANNISIGKFETIKELPWTSEIKNVAIAMNQMSSKIESIINKLNKRLESSTKKLSEDQLTGLCLKQTFETDMKQMFIHKKAGYIFVIKIFDLSAFAKAHTHEEVNDFIKEFAKTLKSTSIKNKKIFIYRFFGSEFALIGEDFSYEDTLDFAKRLQVNLEKLTFKFNKNDIAHIGASQFNPFSTSSQILQSANEAYLKAKLIGMNEAYVQNSNDISRDMKSWRDLVFDIVENSKFNVEYISDARLLDQSNKLVMQEAFTSVKDNENRNIPIGTFVSIAEKYEKIIDFDKKVISKVINHILINKIEHNILINLSLKSINNTTFIAWIENTILKHKKIAHQLVFSLTAYAVAKDMGKFKFFVDEVHKCGARIIIKRFESKFVPLENIKDFNLDYIRLARVYTTDICHDHSKQEFVESIQDLATLLNIKVFAENVKKDEDLQIINNLKLYGTSR